MKKTKTKAKAAPELSPSQKAWVKIRANKEAKAAGKPLPFPPKESKPKQEYAWKARPIEPLKNTKAPELPTGIKIVERPTFADKAVYFTLTRGSFGNYRKLDSEQITVDADKELISATKKLLECDELEAICSMDGAFSRYLKTRSLPSMERSGTYLVPYKRVAEVEQRVRDYFRARLELVATLKAVYVERVKETSARLRSNTKASDYISVEELDGVFHCSWSYSTYTTPGKLKEISAEFFREEQKKASVQWAEAEESLRQVLRLRFTELIAHMAERLSGDDDGRPKVFRSTMLDKIKDFFDTFPDLNLTEDADLQKLVDKAKSVVERVDGVEALKDDEALRVKVCATFEGIKTKLDGMVVAKPGRRILFEE